MPNLSFMERLELQIDSMGDDYFVFATYFAPELVQPNQHVPRTPETAELAGRIWMRIGMRLLREDL